MSSPTISLAALQTFYEAVLRFKFPEMTPEKIQEGAVYAVARVTEHANEHPYQCAVMVVSVGLTPVLGSGWLSTALLKAIGFGPLGPVAGSLASWYQASYLGAYIPAGSVFAWCQHLAMA